MSPQLSHSEAIKVLEERIKKRRKNFLFEIEYQAILVVQDFSLKELFNLAKSAIYHPLAEKWYQDWTSTLILLGNPQKIKKLHPDFIAFQKMGLFGPAEKEAYFAKKLKFLLPPLSTQVLDCRKFERKRFSDFQIFFYFSKFTLEKFILQLFHTFAEIGIERGFPQVLPSIFFGGKEPLRYSFRYYRLDKGGGGLPEKLVHVATAYLL